MGGGTFIKSANQKNKFLISQSKHLLCPLDGSFKHPKQMLKLWGRKYLQFSAEHFVYLDLCNGTSFTP